MTDDMQQILDDPDAFRFELREVINGLQQELIACQAEIETWKDRWSEENADHADDVATAKYEIAACQARERERCAKVCESDPEILSADGIYLRNQQACADAIRALGDE